MDMTSETARATGTQCTSGELRIGDVVRAGAHLATVTDVGTILVAVRTVVGTPRMVCPWELMRLRAAPDERRFGAPAQ